MDITVAIFLVVVVVAFLAWIVVGRTPAHEQGVERPTGNRRSPVERSTFGPAGPGAESQTPQRTRRTPRG